MAGGSGYGMHVGPCASLTPVGAHLNKCTCAHARVQCVRVVVLSNVLHARARADVTGASHTHSAVMWHGWMHMCIACV